MQAKKQSVHSGENAKSEHDEYQYQGMREMFGEGREHDFHLEI